MQPPALQRIQCSPLLLSCDACGGLFVVHVGVTPLMMAADAAHLKMADMLLTVGKADINAQDAVRVTKHGRRR